MCIRSAFAAVLVAGTAVEAQTLTPAQRRSLADLLQLVGGETLNKHDLVRERKCVDAIVDEVDARFTATAPPHLRARFCADDDSSPEADEGEVTAILDSIARQILRDGVLNDCAEIGDNTEAHAKRVRRTTKTIGRACLLGSSVNEVGRSVLTSNDDVATRLTQLLAWRSDRLPTRWTKDAFFISILLLTLAIGALLGVKLNATGQKRVAAAAVAMQLQKRMTRKKCTCALCDESISLAGVLGEGGFGTVYKCAVGVPGGKKGGGGKGDTVALRRRSSSSSGLSPRAAAENVIKMISIDLEEDFNELQEALDEAKHLISFNHINVIEYRDVFVHRAPPPSRQDFVCIVMECCDGGTLKDVVDAGQLDFSGLVDALRQISLALAYLHEQGVLHSDVKLENVLVKSESIGPRYTLKIGDFGLATQLHDVQGGSASSPSKRAAAAAAALEEERLLAKKKGKKKKKKRRPRRRRNRAGKGKRSSVAAAVDGTTASSAAVNTAAANVARKFLTKRFGSKPHLSGNGNDLKASPTPPKRKKRRRRRGRGRGKATPQQQQQQQQQRASQKNSHVEAQAAAQLVSAAAPHATPTLSPSLPTKQTKTWRRKRSAPYSQPHLGYARGVLGGTSAYKSPESFDEAPEQLRTLPDGTVGVSAAVDVWGVGCLLWEAATGEDLPDDSDSDSRDEEDESSESTSSSTSSSSVSSSSSNSYSRALASARVGVSSGVVQQPSLALVDAGWAVALGRARRRSGGLSPKREADVVAAAAIAAKAAAAAEAAGVIVAEAAAMKQRIASVKLLGRFALEATPREWDAIVETLHQRFEMGLDRLLAVEATRRGGGSSSSADRAGAAAPFRTPSKRRRRRRSGGGGGGNPFSPLVDKVAYADDAARHMERCRASRKALTRLLTQMLARHPSHRPRMRDVTVVKELSADEFFFAPIERPATKKSY